MAHGNFYFMGTIRPLAWTLCLWLGLCFTVNLLGPFCICIGYSLRDRGPFWSVETKLGMGMLMPLSSCNMENPRWHGR